MTQQNHPQVSIDEMAHAFEDESGPVDLSHYAIEDWLTLAVFWGMAICVFLQFFTRYALNNSLAGNNAANLLTGGEGNGDVRELAGDADACGGERPA